MFQLTADEFDTLRSHLATSNIPTSKRGGRHHASRMFTEHGAMMAASLLNSPRAVEVSIYVVRACARARARAAARTCCDKRGADSAVNELGQKTEALAMGHDTFSRNTRTHRCGPPMAMTSAT